MCQYCPYAAYSSSNIDRHVLSVHFKKGKGQDEDVSIVRETSPAISKIANRKRKLSDGSVSEKEDMYRKLSSWMEESQRQLAKVIGPVDSDDTEGLVEEVCDLKAKLASMTRERNRLFATVKKLSDEIGTLRARMANGENLEDAQGMDSHDIYEQMDIEDDSSTTRWVKFDMSKEFAAFFKTDIRVAIQ